MVPGWPSTSGRRFGGMPRARPPPGGRRPPSERSFGAVLSGWFWGRANRLGEPRLGGDASPYGASSAASRPLLGFGKRLEGRGGRPARPGLGDRGWVRWPSTSGRRFRGYAARNTAARRSAATFGALFRSGSGGRANRPGEPRLGGDASPYLWVGAQRAHGRCYFRSGSEGGRTRPGGSRTQSGLSGEAGSKMAGYATPAAEAYLPRSVSWKRRARRGASRSPSRCRWPRGGRRRRGSRRTVAKRSFSRRGARERPIRRGRKLRWKLRSSLKCNRSV